MKIKYIKLLGLFCLLIYSPLCAQTADPAILDASITQGRLDNGFTYYIKQVPSKKIYMELNVKAGTTQEETDQYELAHFLEHVGFIKTKNVSSIKTDILVGGLTDSNVTTFKVQVPQADKSGFKKGLLWFSDLISGNLEFHRKDIDSERERFYQEYVFRDGDASYVRYRIMSTFSDCLQKPLKSEAQRNYVNTFKVGALKRFYHKWYHPGLASLSVVGNINDLDALEKEITMMFSKIPSGNASIKRQNCNKEYLLRPMQFKVFENPRTKSKPTGDQVVYDFSFRDHLLKDGSLKGIKQALCKEIFQRMLHARLIDAGKGYHNHFKLDSYLQPHPAALKIETFSENGNGKKAVKEAFKILYSIKKYGFTKKEWTQAKSDMMGQLQKTSTKSPMYWMDQLRKYSTEGEVLPEDKPEILKNWLYGLSLTTFNSKSKDFFPVMPEDIAVTVPKGGNPKNFHEAEIRSWIEKSKKMAIPYRAENPPSYLIPPKVVAQFPAPKIIDKGIDKGGAHRYLLANGLTLILNPFRPLSGWYKDKVIVHGFSPKGAACFPSKDYYSAIMAPAIVKNAGLGDLNKFDLQQYLEGTSMPFGIRPYIQNYETGIEGKASVGELETLLQLVYLYFTKPRFNKESFRDWKSNEKKDYFNPSYTMANADLNNFIYKALGFEATNPKGKLRYEGTRKVNLPKSSLIYKQLYGQAGNFTFTLNGDFAINKILPLLNRYLGNLPDQKMKKCKKYKDNFKLKAGPSRKVLAYQNIKNSYLKVKYLKKIDLLEDWKEPVKIYALSKLFSYELEKRLNFEKERSVYLSFASNNVNRNKKINIFSITIQCANEQLDSVVQDVEYVSQNMRKKINARTFKKIMTEKVYPHYSISNRTSNPVVSNILYDKYRFGMPYVEGEKIEKFVKSLTKDDILKTAQKYLKAKFMHVYIAKREELE